MLQELAHLINDEQHAPRALVGQGDQRPQSVGPPSASFGGCGFCRFEDRRLRIGAPSDNRDDNAASADLGDERIRRPSADNCGRLPPGTPLAVQERVEQQRERGLAPAIGAGPWKALSLSRRPALPSA